MELRKRLYNDDAHSWLLICEKIKNTNLGKLLELFTKYPDHLISVHESVAGDSVTGEVIDPEKNIIKLHTVFYDLP